MMLSQEGMDLLFNDARTHYVWENRDVSDDLLKQAYDLAKFGPTSANCSPMRIIFVRSQQAKEKLRPCLMEGNVEKTMTAPVTAIIGMDMAFYEELPRLFPHTDARSWFVGNDAMIEATAFRNSSLQGAYFIMAARAVGLDCGGMSGFNNDLVDDVFFKGTSIKSNFLCNLGYGIPEKLYPRSPRLTFNEATNIL